MELEPAGQKGKNQLEVHEVDQKEIENNQLHPNNLIPKLTHLLTDNLKTFLQKIQGSQAQDIRQSVILDAPKFKLNMKGNSIESIQIILESNNQGATTSTIHLLDNDNATDESTNKCMMEEDFNTLNLTDTTVDLEKDRMPTNGPGTESANEKEATLDGTEPKLFAFSALPIKKVNIRKRKKCMKQSNNSQSNTEQAVSNITRPSLARTEGSVNDKTNKRNFSAMNARATIQSPRRGIRLNKKYDGYKNRSILDSTGSRNNKASKKRKITSIK